MPELSAKQINNFWSRVNVLGDADCWTWMGQKKPSGFGNVGLGMRTYVAHRIVYQIRFGEIPGGAYVLHSCNNNSCCNPAHLYLGTKPGSKLDYSKAADIIDRYKAGDTQDSLAEAYGVAQSTINKAVNGQRWKHLRWNNG